MRIVGRLMLQAGLILFLCMMWLYSPTVDATVSSSVMADLGTIGAALPRSTVNLERLQTQQLWAVAGLTLFVGGLIMETAGAVVEALRSRVDPSQD